MRLLITSSFISFSPSCASGPCLSAPPPALRAWIQAVCSLQSGCEQRQLGLTQDPERASGEQSLEQELQGRHAGRAGNRGGHPATALGGWGRHPALDGCHHVLPALPSGLLVAVAGDEAHPGYQPLLSRAGKCSAVGAEGRR